VVSLENPRSRRRKNVYFGTKGILKTVPSQPCCLHFSPGLAAITGPVLVLGLIAQVVPLPFRGGQQSVRLVLWALGWLVWLFSGLVSFLHAFG
jgi:predicted membrane-bound dolichyl-phosphate-mannose-protein mannosyltransferase